MLATYVLGFATGVSTHARDFVTQGWRPYDWAPTPLLEVFWTSLIVLDAGVILLLLLGRRRAGLLLALAVMTTDVTANGYALFGLAMPFFTPALVVQAAFLGFVLASMPFLWPAHAATSAASVSAIHPPPSTRSPA